MNTRNLRSALFVVAALASAHGFAADAPAPTRAQVNADYLQARAQGTLAPTGEVQFQANAPRLAPPAPGLSRDAVHSAYLQAARNGALAPRGEGADIGYVAAGPSAVARAAVRAEAVYAVRSGQFAGGEVGSFGTPARRVRKPS